MKNFLVKWKKELEEKLKRRKERKERIVSLKTVRKTIRREKGEKKVKISEEKRDKIITNIICYTCFIIILVGICGLEWIVLQNTYSNGFNEGYRISDTYDEVNSLYAGEDITTEQYNEFLEAYQDIMNAIWDNSELSSKILKRYNKAIKNISYIDYSYSKLSGVSVWYKRGLQDKIKIEEYLNQIENAYKADCISQEKRDSFQTIKSNAKKNYKGSRLVIEKAEEILSMAEVIDTSNEDSEEENLDYSYAEDINKTYADGQWDCKFMYSLRTDIVNLYNGGYVTYDQASSYFESVLSLTNLFLEGEDIPPEEIEKYNDIVKQIEYVNFDIYEIKSSGKEYLNGFVDFIQVSGYNQIINSLYEEGKIPDNEYKDYVSVYNQKNDLKQENVIFLKATAKELIELCGEDAETILEKTEWRKYLTVDDFLRELSN